MWPGAFDFPSTIDSLRNLELREPRICAICGALARIHAIRLAITQGDVTDID